MPIITIFREVILYKKTFSELLEYYRIMTENMRLIMASKHKDALLAKYVAVKDELNLRRVWSE